MREEVQEAVGEIAFDRGVREKAGQQHPQFPSYGTADCLVKELLYLKVICPGTSKTNQAASKNQHGTEMTKAIESNITEHLRGACQVLPVAEAVAPKAHQVTARQGYLLVPLSVDPSYLFKRRHNLQAVPLRHRT
jgi:hypothetical protein